MILFCAFLSGDQQGHMSNRGDGLSTSTTHRRIRDTSHHDEFPSKEDVPCQLSERPVRTAGSERCTGSGDDSTCFLRDDDASADVPWPFFILFFFIIKKDNGM